jgi:cell filamentation protein
MNAANDKYDVSGNVEAQYVDEAQEILVNKRGITDLRSLQIAEEEALAKAYARLLAEVRTDTPMTCELLQHIHRCIFGELYDWAGRWRTVQISKPGAIWPAAQFLDQSMSTFEREVLAKYPAGTLANDDLFCATSSEIQGEFLSIHPFREGNARTIKLMNNLLAAQTGRPLLAYDMSSAGQNSYVDAARAALAKQDYKPLETIIRQALETAKSDQSP